ncbi:MAG: Yip1 family protein [Bacillota bacterium]
MEENKEVLEETHATGEESPLEVKSPDTLEILYGIMARPASTIEKVAKRPPVGTALLVFTVSTVITTLVGTRDASFYGHSIPNLRAFTTLVTVAGLIFAYSTWFIGTAIVHLWAELLGGRGRALALFAAGGLLSFIQLFTVPAALIAMAVGEWFSNMVAFAVLIWTVVLYVISIKAVYQMSVGRAVAALLLPVLVAALAVGALVAIMIAGIMATLPLLQQQFPFFP